jgi:hypothetical protein
VDRAQGQTDTVNLLVTWRFRGRSFSQVVIIPSGSGSHSTRDVLAPLPGGAEADLFSSLQSVSEDYGVPIIVNGYLTQRPSVMQFGDSGLEQALRAMLKPAGLDWLFADGAVYVDREYPFVVSE